MKWPIIRLNQICGTQYGYTASADENIVGPKYLRITDIASGPIDWESVPYCKIPESDYYKYKLKPGDIVIARTGNTTGFAKLIRDDEDAVFASYLVRLKIKSNLADSGYVGRLIESDIYKNFVTSIKGGAAQGNANATTLTLFEFPLPPINIQRTITLILSAYDDLIDTNRRRIQLLEESARLLFREWFVYFRFPGHEKAKIVDGVPEGWERGLLEDIATVKKGRNITFEQAIEGDIPVVGGGLGPTYYHNKANVSAPVVTISASGANAGYVNLYGTDIWASDCSYIDRKSTKYIYYFYLRLRSIQTSIFGLQVGAAQPHVYPRDLNRIKLLIPPDDLYFQFEQLVTPIFDLIKNLKLENQKLAQARDLLLPRLMNGTIEA
ncbi:MAG TPA: restriction endonuclease subunit S [Candidatus Marinimicrobia bacterium]|nr:restriction endonuclease subunit S [Candidatus Neomarinimicrobiota bacterium]